LYLFYTETMKVLTNKEISEIKLIMPDLNFGQTNDIPLEKLLNYELEIDKQEFIGKCGAFFEEVRQLEISETEDVEEDGDDMNNIWKTYKKIAYPGLNELFTEHKDLLEGIMCFYDYEFLHELVKPNRTKDSKFALLLNMEHLSVAETIVFSGKCVIISNE